MPEAPHLSGSHPPKLLARLRAAIRARHYSPRTEESYASWVRRFVVFHGRRHPATMGEVEVQAFLAHLADHGRVSAATYNQAVAALLFLYEAVLGSSVWVYASRTWISCGARSACAGVRGVWTV